MAEVCQLCNDPATRDAKLKVGPWAYVCEKHFQLSCYQTKGLSSIINQDELKRQTNQTNGGTKNGQT